MNKKTDFIIGMIFAIATIIFIVLFLTNDTFFNWAFARHHNILSWYIRPLFIIPMVIFAFKKSFTGIFATIFALFTSMFWFPIPAEINPQVLEFLAFEYGLPKRYMDSSQNTNQLGSTPVFHHAYSSSMEEKLEMAYRNYNRSSCFKNYLEYCI